MKDIVFFLIGFSILSASCAPQSAPTRGRTGALSMVDGAPGQIDARDPGYTIEELTNLRTGRYEMTVSGVLSNAGTRAVVEEVKKIKDVENVSFDYEDGFLRIEVPKDKQISSRQLQRAVRRAGRRTRLGRKFWVTEIRFSRR